MAKEQRTTYSTNSNANWKCKFLLEDAPTWPNFTFSSFSCMSRANGAAFCTKLTLKCYQMLLFHAPNFRLMANRSMCGTCEQIVRRLQPAKLIKINCFANFLGHTCQLIIFVAVGPVVRRPESTASQS